jgi:hypothetical protein
VSPSTLNASDAASALGLRELAQVAQVLNGDAQSLGTALAAHERVCTNAGLAALSTFRYVSG